MGIFSGLSTIATFFAPALAIPAKVVSAVVSWRPSFSEIVIIIVSILFCVQTLRIEGLSIKPHIGPFKFTLISIEGFKTEVQDLTDDLAAREKAEKDARDAQIKVNEQLKIDSTIAAEKTNAQAIQDKPQIDAAANAYIASHTVPQCMRSQSSQSVLSGQTDMRQPPDVSGSISSSDVSPGMVAISVDDFNGYKTNTQDLLELRAFIKSMIDEGHIVIDTNVATDAPKTNP